MRGHLLSDWHLIRYCVGEVVGKQANRCNFMKKSAATAVNIEYTHFLGPSNSTSRNLSFGDFHSV